MSILMFTEWAIGIFLALLVHVIGYYIIGKTQGRKAKKLYIGVSWGFHVFSSRDKWFVNLFPKMKDRPEFEIGWLPIAADVDFTEPVHTSKDVGDDKEMIMDFAGVFANLIIGLLCIILYQIYKSFAGSELLYNFAMMNLLTASFVGVMIVFAHCVWQIYVKWQTKN